MAKAESCKGYLLPLALVGVPRTRQTANTTVLVVNTRKSVAEKAVRGAVLVDTRMKTDVGANPCAIAGGAIFEHTIDVIRAFVVDGVRRTSFSNMTGREG